MAQMGGESWHSIKELFSPTFLILKVMGSRNNGCFEISFHWGWL